MFVRRLPATEPAVRRYVEDLWVPYHRDLSAIVDSHALTADESVDVVAAETDWRLDRLESSTLEIWIAVDASADQLDDGTTDAKPPEAVDIAAIDAPLAGFVTIEIDEAPVVFDRPDRLVVGDLYVTESSRGRGLGRTLMETAADRARDHDCPELRLDVDVDNERARAFYETLGFEPDRHQLRLDASEL